MPGKILARRMPAFGQFEKKANPDITLAMVLWSILGAVR